MQKRSNFQVYNASAGSGKTFTLVKEYLKVLVNSEDIFRFQKILAITFTNKAAGEMKDRVLKNLQGFSEGKENDLFQVLLEETTLEKELIKNRSRKILDAILQNYSAFSITTIDSFTHKVIKSFAFDLGLSLNFEVEMDAISLLNEAVDMLISKIGNDKEITQLLINFSLEKADDDTSWDISRELNEFSRILLNEEDNKHFRKLSEKKIEDFLFLKKKLKAEQSKIEKSFFDTGNLALELIKESGLSHAEFAYSGEVPKHFVRLKKYRSTKTGDIKFDGRLDKTIENEKPFYAAKTDVSSKDVIDGIQEQLIGFYQQSKLLYEVSNPKYVLNKLALKSIIPLAVLNNINSELTTIKESNNIRLNAEFNQLISDNIKEQPAPFIYERLGQKFMHYFIDEMQDTSELQWQNLIPLINNALAQENSNLLLVGDGKQAIYSWRGGKALQFINLGKEGEGASNPFQIEKEIRELETNYRSYSEVINFNNLFFQHVSNFIHNETYKNLFIEGNNQIETAKKGGFVSLNFLEKEEEKEIEDLKYPKKVFEILKKLNAGFSLRDVCVLVRKKKDGIAVANYLSEKGIPIISSETLLLSNSSKVNFIIGLLQVVQHSNDKETWLEVLYFLHHHFSVSEDKHLFINGIIHEQEIEIFQQLKKYGSSFELTTFYELPFYEKVEEIIRGFHLLETSDAYVQFFLDIVLEQQRKGTSSQEFLDFWENKKEVLSIVAPESAEAVQVMTIHKSKGLEFPIVIFPCDLDIYRQIQPKIWLNNLEKEQFGGFEELLVPFGKDLGYVSEEGLQLYEEQRKELELDNFNLLYVALTRAVEQLYIITEKKISSKGIENTNHYSGIFINYLKENNLWNENQLTYVFGDETRISKKKEEISLAETQQHFISTPWQDHQIHMLTSSSKLWDTKKGEAIEFGNLVHEMMSKVFTAKDVASVVDEYLREGVFNNDKKQDIAGILHKIVHHPELVDYFSEDIVVFNEREIVDVDNQVIIPDRLVFISNNESIIIDYKTGQSSKSYHQQLLRYERVLKSMHIKVVKKLLIYIGEEILVEEI